jgi:hypothetical protein
MRSVGERSARSPSDTVDRATANPTHHHPFTSPAIQTPQPGSLPLLRILRIVRLGFTLQSKSRPGRLITPQNAHYPQNTFFMRILRILRLVYKVEADAFSTG